MTPNCLPHQEVLPRWSEECTSQRTRLLWWEGIPEHFRSAVWPRALAPVGSAEGSLPVGVLAFDRIRTMLSHDDRLAAIVPFACKCSARRSSPPFSPQVSHEDRLAAASTAKAFFSPPSKPTAEAATAAEVAAAAAADSGSHGGGSSSSSGGGGGGLSGVRGNGGLGGHLPPELNMFTSPESPLNASLIALLACCHASARHDGPPPPPAAPLLGCMLLLYMDEPMAYACMQCLADSHCVGARAVNERKLWRLRAAEAMFAREVSAA